MRSTIISGIILLTLVGCGGTGSGGISGGTSQATARSASLPGADVTVQRKDGQATAGTSVTYRITSSAAVTAVEVFVGPDWEHPTTATTFAVGSGIWDASLTLPSPIPSASAVLVRLTLADGNIVETGADFPL